MTDVHTPEQRTRNMRAIKGRDTKPELLLRRALHARGLRYRLHRKDLPGRPDIVFPRHRVCVFVNGCFWHGHDCPLFKEPRTRNDFWMTKIESNRKRDIAATEALIQEGWRVLTVWECALKGRQIDQLNPVIDNCIRFLMESSAKCQSVSRDVRPKSSRKDLHSGQNSLSRPQK